MSGGLLEKIHRAKLLRCSGQVTQFFGLIIESNGPDVSLGERCEIRNAESGLMLTAEVVGIRDGKVLLMPYGELRGIRKGSEIIATGEQVKVPVGEALLGRVIDAFGNPLDDGPQLMCKEHYDLFADPINPMLRPPISAVLETGVKAIDTFLTIGRGQRLGIFSGSGVGKSTLLGMIARNMTADINVIALIGERGREVAEFIRKNLKGEVMKRSVVVVATSDQSALLRSHAALAATAIAEYFRDRGLHVLLTMDSLTRFAMAQREIGLSIGEPPTARGYTPSAFAMLPRLLERAGTGPSGGTITALYTVLVEGDDMNEPVADHVRAVVDGHIVLTRKLANQAHFPSIDILQSNSRLANELRTAEQTETVLKTQRLYSLHQQNKDMLDLGAYHTGNNLDLDKAIALLPGLQKFLNQTEQQTQAAIHSFSSLRDLLKSVGG